MSETSCMISAIGPNVVLSEVLSMDNVLCNVIKRVSAKLHSFTYFVFLCARRFIMQFEFKINFFTIGGIFSNFDKTLCALNKCDQDVVKFIGP